MILRTIKTCILLTSAFIIFIAALFIGGKYYYRYSQRDAIFESALEYYKKTEKYEGVPHNLADAAQIHDFRMHKIQWENDSSVVAYGGYEHNGITAINNKFKIIRMKDNWVVVSYLNPIR